QVFDSRAGADRVEGNAVQLVVRSNFRTRVLDYYIAQNTGVVLIVDAAVVALSGASLALGNHVALPGRGKRRVGAVIGALVGHTKTVDHESAPLLDILGVHSAEHRVGL